MAYKLTDDRLLYCIINEIFLFEVLPIVHNNRGRGLL